VLNEEERPIQVCVCCHGEGEAAESREQEAGEIGERMAIEGIE